VCQSFERAARKRREVPSALLFFLEGQRALLEAAFLGSHGATAGRSATTIPRCSPDYTSPRPSRPRRSFSRTDGVAHWRACREREAPHTDNIEIRGSHCGLGFNPVVFCAIADRLAQPDAGWQPFVRDGWRRLFYK